MRSSLLLGVVVLVLVFGTFGVFASENPFGVEATSGDTLVGDTDSGESVGIEGKSSYVGARERIARNHEGTRVVFERVPSLGDKKTKDVTAESWDRYGLSLSGQPKLNVLITYFEKEDLFSIASLGKGKISTRIIEGMQEKLDGAETDAELEVKLQEALLYLEKEIDKLDKGWDVSKNGDESFDTLVKIYEEGGRIDLPLVVDAYMRMEFAAYPGEKKFEKYDEFVNFRMETLIKGMPAVRSISDSWKIKDEVHERLELSNYNKAHPSLIDPFFAKKYQCRSSTRATVTTVLSTQFESISRGFLVLHTNGHTLPGFVENGNLIGIEATLKGNTRVNFGKINADKSLEGQEEKVIAVRADHQLFLDVLAGKGGNKEIREKLISNGIVVDNKGPVTSGSDSPTGQSFDDTFSFGQVDVPEGDIKVGERSEEIEFQGSQIYYDDMEYGTGQAGQGGTGTNTGSGQSGGGESSVDDGVKNSFNGEAPESKGLDLSTEEKIYILEVLSDYIRYSNRENKKFYLPSQSSMEAIQEQWGYDFSYILEKGDRVSYILAAYSLFHDNLLETVPSLYAYFPNKGYPESQDGYDAWKASHAEFREIIAKGIDEYVVYLRR